MSEEKLSELKKPKEPKVPKMPVMPSDPVNKNGTNVSFITPNYSLDIDESRVFNFASLKQRILSIMPDDIKNNVNFNIEDVKFYFASSQHRRDSFLRFRYECNYQASQQNIEEYQKRCVQYDVDVEAYERKLAIYHKKMKRYHINLEKYNAYLMELKNQISNSTLFFKQCINCLIK